MSKQNPPRFEPWPSKIRLHSPQRLPSLLLCPLTPQFSFVPLPLCYTPSKPCTQSPSRIQLYPKHRSDLLSLVGLESDLEPLNPSTPKLSHTIRLHCRGQRHCPSHLLVAHFPRCCFIPLIPDICSLFQTRCYRPLPHP
jgi:hypothetical protein